MFRVMDQAMKKSIATPRSTSIDLSNVRSSSQFYTFHNGDTSQPNSHDGTPAPTVNRMLSGSDIAVEATNKKLLSTLQEVKQELHQQREFSNMLNKTHQELQLQYSRDTQQWMSQISDLSREKQELMKDLDLALEREAVAAKKRQNESKQWHEKIDKIPKLTANITALQDQNSQLITNNNILNNVVSKIDQLINMNQVEANKNAENHEKIKLVFEDTAIQLDKYHENQQLLSSMRKNIEIIQNERQLCYQFTFYYLQLSYDCLIQ